MVYLICQMTRALLNKLGNKIVNSSENSPLVVRLWCKKRIKKKNWWKSLQWTDRCSIFCLKLLFVIRSHGKICPRLYRINEDGNFMKRSAKCRPVQSAVSKQSLRVSKSLLFFFSPLFLLFLSRLYHSVDFLLFCSIYISLFRIIRIDLVVASYLNLISYFFSLFHHCEWCRT